MTIRKKISISFLMTAVTITAMCVGIVYTIVNRHLQDAIFSHLSATAESRARHVETFLEEHASFLRIAAIDASFAELLSTSSDAPRYRDLLAEVNARLTRASQCDPQILQLSLLDSTGVVIGSSDERLVGLDKSTEESYLRARHKTHATDIRLCGQCGKPVMAVSAPLVARGEFLGVVWGRLDLEPLFQITLDRTGLGKTGEVYLVNKDEYLMSPTRHAGNAILQQKISTLSVVNCLKNRDGGDKGDFKKPTVFVGYRGVDVLGTHEYIASTGWCLLAEIDAEEALAPLRTLRMMAIVVMVAAPLVALLIGRHVSEIITGPIRRLQMGTRAVSAGNLGYRVNTDAKDEIGELGRAFDNMVESLGKATTTIDKLNREIAERKRVESELLTKNQAIESSINAIALADLYGEVSYVNESFVRMWRYDDKSQVLGRRATEFWESNEAAELARSQVIQTGGWVGELAARRADGSSFDAQLSASLVRGENGKPICMMASFIDVTEQKRANEELRRERDRAQRYLDVAGVILIALDAGGRVVLVNRRGSEVLGCEEQEIIGENWFDEFVPNEERAKKKRRYEAIISGQDEVQREYEARIVAKDGMEKSIAWRNTVLRDESGEIVGTLSSGEDVTERRRMERELVRLERLSALGEMAAGVSHNLNNILVGVLGHAQFLEQKTDDPEILQDVRDIIKSARRAEALVERVNAAVRGEEEGLEPVTIPGTVREAVQEARGWFRLKEKGGRGPIDIVTDLGDVPLIRGTRSGLQDIVMNLLVNAAEAMPNGGTMTISLKAMDEDVLLAVSDTGVGMSEDARKRLFEPFFTTKSEVGRGLGLSIVYGTVTRWGGRISVRSAPGRGSTFTASLPSWKGPKVLGEGSRKAKREALIPGKTVRILVVENEQVVYEVLERLLAKDHEVEVVTSGAEALQRLEDVPYGVVLIDLGLPDLQGDQLARRIRREHASVATILLTGWQLGEDDEKVSDFDFWIQKPFGSLTKVADLVGRALELHHDRVRSASAAPVRVRPT